MQGQKVDSASETYGTKKGSNDHKNAQTQSAAFKYIFNDSYYSTNIFVSFERIFDQ